MTEFGAAASSSSSSFTYGWPYHVFLSFRGEDTRQGFTGHLYNALHKRGIRTFLDDEGIRKGEDITPTLLKTIEESKTAIVVFSKNYASSSFCLAELVQILNCMKGRNGRFIWPVFYDVDPSDIRHQTGSYKDAFDQHERVKDEKIVKLWRLALTEAANMSGWHFELEPRSKSYEYEMMEEIIGVVSKEISIGPLHISQFSAGLKSRVKEVCSLLNIQPHVDGATMVGICGIGGIGKTTIARAVYNEIVGQFQYSCFLSNIKEKSIQDLQEILLSETIGEKDIKLNYDKSGIPIIKDRLHNKKVILILDDIDRLEQLRALAGESNWFGFGSIIIITTRDRSLLKNHEVERIYEVKELTCEEARQLLILNAFKNKEANPGYVKVIQRAVEYASGLPLVLEILGSNFHICQTIEEWETALDIYEKIPEKSVQKILKVSYDGLEDTQREIFLDIACFYRGQSLGYATKILSASHGIGVEFCIRVLIDKSLIKIDDYGYLDMHDLIQDMGQEIVRQESPIDVGRRSRLWSSKDILHVLKENTGNATIQAMNLLFNFHDEKVEWSGEAFEKMKNLRVLSFVYGIKFSQGPKCLPNSVRVVEWDSYPSATLPDDFCPINLVILRLTSSRLKTLGKAFKYSYSLRQLNLKYSENLEEIPDISEAVNLEELEVSYCKKLTKIDDSVGHLAKLRVLVAKRCVKLDTFIVGGIKLISLEILSLKECSNLHTFPEILVTMEKIKTLDLSHTAIKILPESFQKLVSLKELKLTQPPNLASHNLKTLDLDGCKQLKDIRGIPSNIEVFFAWNCTFLTSCFTRPLSRQYFYNLRQLILRYNENLEEISDISGAANLEELNVNYCQKLTKIDDSVGHLTKLRVLNAQACIMLDTFIAGGIKLVSLEILNLKECSNLHTFPEILVTMKNIKILDLSCTAIKALPESFEKLVALEKLCLHDCGVLCQLPNLACRHLKTLCLDECKEFQEITGILPNVEVSAWNRTSLSSHSTRLSLTQELHETRNIEFILPGKEIPKWFHKRSIGSSVSFWVHKKFPQIALCAVVTDGPFMFCSFVIFINGTNKFKVRHHFLSEIETDHIFLFDLTEQQRDRIEMVLLEKEMNHVEVSWGDLDTRSRVKCIGVYVYNYCSCIKDILFENPIHQQITLVEIYDSNLKSPSVYYDFMDNSEEDDKLNKEIMVLFTETVSNIKRKKGQLKVDDVNLTLSLALPEPSSDTTSHHDDKLKKEIMDSSPKAVSSIEKKKRKLKMDDENLTLSLALPKPSSDTTSHDDLQQQQHLTSINQQIPKSYEIIKKTKGKDIIVYEGNTNGKKGGNTLENYQISSNSESLNWDPMTWEYQLMCQKDQSTIIDKVYDGSASCYSKDLQQQHHLTSIHQQILKSSENVKNAKGKDIMVYGGNSNEKQGSNTLEGQLQELVHRQTKEEELHLANNEILTLVLGQKTRYLQDKDYGARPPSKRTSDQITDEYLQEQKKKIRKEVVVEVHEEMRLLEERMRVEFEEWLHSQIASLLSSFQ